MDLTPDGSVTRGLVGKAQEGDSDAFAALMDKYERRLEALIHVRLGPSLRQRVEVEDVLQETYLNAFRSIATYEWRDEGSFFKWLGGIAENVLQRLARHHLHTGKRMLSREVSLEQCIQSAKGDPGKLEGRLRAHDTSPSDVLRRKERFERLEKALGKLTPDHREVIILAVLRGLSMREIASQMGRSAPAVSMLLLRALRALRGHFGSTDSFRLPLEELAGLSSKPGTPGEARPDDEGKTDQQI
jgi:RNA polymerase sigma-70 factor (ECF subfamily)